MRELLILAVIGIVIVALAYARTATRMERNRKEATSYLNDVYGGMYATLDEQLAQEQAE